MASPTPPARMTDRVRAFLAAPRFASLATVDQDGRPRQSIVWYLLEDDTLIVNSRVGRRWPTNLQRDGRVALSLVDPADGYRWLGMTGHVDVLDDPAEALAHISAMARRYHPHDPRHAEDLIERTFRPQRRISFRVHPDEINDHLD